MEGTWTIISAICAVIAVGLSIRIYMKDERYKKFKVRPVFYIRSHSEDRVERYIEIEVTNIKSQEVKDIEIKWIGNELVKLKCNKILKNNEENLWDYKITLNLSNTKIEEDVIGKILIECTTVYDERVTFKKDVEVYSKYYPLIEGYSQEMKGMSNEVFDNY